MLIINLNHDTSKINRYLSNTLLEKIEESLRKKKKSILYLNKRGTYSSLICPKCSKVFTCKNCDISLSVHQESMICHICGTTEKLKIRCDNCGYDTLEKVGVGTEQIESALHNIFSHKKIFRLDTDKVKNKGEKEKALENLKKSDIIIGTKMITTGFDFENVGLIGVILLEQELIGNKYNTEEQLYSNIKQLLGRGGRKGEITNFLIQTFVPENDLIQKISSGNYKDFFIQTLSERKLFSYPPYNEFAILEYRNKDKQRALKYTKNIFIKLQQHSNNHIKIIFSKNSFKKYSQYYYKIIIKGENLRDFLGVIKGEILKEKNLSVIFE